MARAKKNSKLAENATCTLVNIVAVNAARKGIQILDKQGFMQSDSAGMNIKKIGAKGGATIAFGAASMFTENRIIHAALSGASAGASTEAVDEAERALGLSGLGAADPLDLLHMYDAPESTNQAFDLRVEQMQNRGQKIVVE